MAHVETPRVCLVVVAATDVGKVQASSGMALNPYCQTQCGDVVLRTASQCKTTSPKWTQTFTFGVKKPLGDAVTFKVFGLNERGRDVLLGGATLPIKTLTPDSEMTHKLMLLDAAGKSCGELTVLVRYEPNFMAPPRNEMGRKLVAPTKLVAPVSPKHLFTVPVTAEQQSFMQHKAENSSLIPSATQEVIIPPNFYVVTVLEAVDLLAYDGKGIEATSDPYVRVSCTNNPSQRTKTRQQTLHPSWRQRFYFKIVPGEKQLLELRVEDSDLLTGEFMGRCVIDLTEFTKIFHGYKQTLWLALEQRPESEGKKIPSDLSPQRKQSYGYGKVCLAIETRYIDQASSSFEQGEVDHITEVPSCLGVWCTGSSNVAIDEEGSNYNDNPIEEVDGDKDNDDAEAKSKEADAQRTLRENERKTMLAELSNVQFQSGDYQIRVRIIEVRDLQPMDANGLCDPVVSVECLGQRQYTRVKQKQTSCVFDEYLYFDFSKLDKATAQQGSIKISVFDADGPGLSANRSALFRAFDDLIGFFSVDVPYVYYQPDHTLKRKWVALVGSGTTNSDSIQGYVLLSLVVLGPGDTMKLFDPAEDRDPDEHLVKSKADVNSLVLVPPRVTQNLSFLVITVYRAEELPDMDYSMMMHGGIDGYVRAYFAGQDVLETKKVTMKGSENLVSVFNQELWLPVLLPTLSDNIFISVWDWDMATADQLVANIVQPYSFKQVQRDPNQFKHIWANLYGPPLGYDTDSGPLRLMQSHPVHASTYRGRLLLSLRVEDGLQSVHDDAHVRNLLITSTSPRMKRYTLRAALFYGTEIPVFTSKTNWNRSTRMSLKISVGRHSVESSRVPNVSGICHFNQYIDLIDLDLPADLNQAPDIFVHLIRKTMNESRGICFARFRAQNLFCQDIKSIEPPHWVVLNEDKVIDDLKDHDFTGNVLMNLRLDDAERQDVKENEVAQQWRQYAGTTMQYMKYVLFVHVFQGKSLPSTDYDGLLDPYVKVACAGAVGQVSTRISTRDPCFYETVVLDVELPQNDRYLPKASLQVYDWDRYKADDYVGGLKFSLVDVLQMTSSEYAKIRASGEYSAPRPKWRPIYYEKPGDTEGELLLSFDLIRKDTPGALVEPPESIDPPVEVAYIEIMCLGCRGLQPTGFMPINTPFVKFEVGESTKTNQPKFTNPSSTPSSHNPNILQRIVIPVKMPLDSLFAPRLNITVYDQLLGGLYKPVIGVSSVDLGKLMPFSNGEPNPQYAEEMSKSTTRGRNPFVDYGDDLSTFPGTVPSNIVTARSPSAQSRSKVNTIGMANTCSFRSFGMEDDEDELPHYMHQREIVDGELEDVLKSPFESFTLFRGAIPSHEGVEICEKPANTYRPVGKVKGIVRVLKSRDEPPLFDLNEFINPRPYLVRVYILDALNLHPTDINNKCDPYLQVSLGDGHHREQVFNDRDNYQPETLTPRFHKMFEFKADLPGASELKIEVLDYDFYAIPTLPTGLSKALRTAVGSTISGDDFVGATRIDLEDRWFDTKWQKLGLSPGRPEPRKPLEVRPLFAPSSSRSQGHLRLWVDILSGATMNVVRPLDISLPPRQVFEVRVIVYKAKNVTAGDFTDLSDLFVKCWLQSRHDRCQSTDTHWRAKRGRASFNWRMKFDIELPLDPEKEADRGHLHFQLWDRDVVYDDCLADAVVDLTSFLKMAFKTNQAVNVFAKPKLIRIRGTETLPSKEASRREGYSATKDARVAARTRSSCAREVIVSIAEDEGEARDTKRLLLGNDIDVGSDESEPEDEDTDMENAQSLVKSFMHRLGMGDDPDDATWLTMTTRDSTTGDRTRAGELLVAVEILPMLLANVRAAGLGRGEPNTFPFLPEPADRLHLSAMWNPCYVLEALMGPKYYRAFASVFLCTLFSLLVLFTGPLLNVLLTLFELMPNPLGLICFFLALGGLMGTLVYYLYRCRRAVLRIADGKNLKTSKSSKR